MAVAAIDNGLFLAGNGRESGLWFDGVTDLTRNICPSKRPCRAAARAWGMAI
jgi:hypothetical protein